METIDTEKEYGKYIKNEIKHSTFNISHITLAEDEKTHKEEFQEPLTILLPKDNLKTFQLDNLTKGEKEKVKEHVQSFRDSYKRKCLSSNEEKSRRLSSRRSVII